LQLHHFRSYADYAVEFESGVNIVVGPNGSGKTNLLEALYVLSAGSSFRAADRDLLKRGEDWFRLEGLFGDQQRIMTYRVAGDVVEK
jgi:DNA replication and repair protein RecF